MKKWLSCILLSVLSFTVLSVLSPAVSAEGEEFLLNYQDVDFSVERPESTVEPDGVTNTVYLNTSYSSVSQGQVTLVKNQGSYGTCWAFSATSACESSLIGKGGYTAQNIDLSEMQLIGYTYQNRVDPLGNLTGDKTTITRGSILTTGGNNVFTMWSLVGWVNGARESDLPYTEAYQNQALNGTLPDNLANSRDVAHVQNVRIIPISSQEADLLNIKKGIVDYGSLCASVDYDTSGSFYNTPYYYTVLQKTNHAITLVGWNDTVAKENFTYTDSSGVTQTPAGNGAWLVKNSWGTNWGTDGDASPAHSGKAGYFWLSYYDASLCSSSCAYAYVTETTETYRNNYQYDGSFGSRYTSFASGTSVAATYKTGSSSGWESLRAVGIGLKSVDVNYSVQIYRNTDAENPVSGAPLLETPVTGKTSYAGYYTIPLPTNGIANLKKGEYFSVVITLSTDNGDSVAVFADKTYQNGDWIKFTADTENDLTWHTNNQGVFCRESSQTLRIKAYTQNASGPTSPDEIIISNAPSSLSVGGSYSLTVEFLPEGSSAALSWSSSDTKVATVSANGVLNALSEGYTTIQVTADNIKDSFSLWVRYPTGWNTINGKKTFIRSDGSRGSGWLTYDESVYYLLDDGTPITGWVRIDGEVYYMDADGVMLTGWLRTPDGGLYYMNAQTGCMMTGWLRDTEGNVYYMDDETGRMLTGWIRDPDGYLYYMNDNGVMQTGWITLPDGEDEHTYNTYYADEYGHILTGWITLPDDEDEHTYNTYYLNENGIMLTGWLKTPDGSLYYMSTEDGHMLKNCWLKDADGNRRFADEAGRICKGWKRLDSKWYYFDDNGIRQDGWVQVSGKWYYMSSSGIMQTGWINDDGAWYYMNSSGAMQTGWVNDGGRWYYMASTGKMQTDWVQSGGKWYYMASSGEMQTGWVQSGGKWYYMNTDGIMATGWVQSGGAWYYMNSNGTMATGWVQVGGVWYYMDSDGTMATGWVQVGGTWYYMNSDGVWMA